MPQTLQHIEDTDKLQTAMSRRPPAQDASRTAQNQATLKTLVKVESNKSCADCKRNKRRHDRTLECKPSFDMFQIRDGPVGISAYLSAYGSFDTQSTQRNSLTAMSRCSGIHRGMGTHISRVKSVDLDAWTDEQMASILKWGNARANKYVMR